MTERTHNLSVTKQAVALGISRGAVYYEPRPRSAADCALMRRIDAVHLEMPQFGARGFVYLAAVMDWATRKVLSWRVSITTDPSFCLVAVEEAIARYGRPEIFNTDQGAQLTSAAFTGLFTSHGIQVSMDGKGCWRDSIFIERLWCSLKYEEVYLHGDDSVRAATAGIARYFTLYNTCRQHSSLSDQTPDTAFFSHATHPVPQPLPLAA